MLHDVKVHDAIQEFQPLQITEHRTVLLALLVSGILSIVIFRGVQLRLGEALLALGGIYFAMRHQRLLFLVRHPSGAPYSPGSSLKSAARIIRRAIVLGESHRISHRAGCYGARLSEPARTRAPSRTRQSDRLGP
jgi:hypothetical protein